MAGRINWDGDWKVIWKTGKSTSIKLDGGKYKYLGREYELELDKEPVQFKWADGTVQSVATCSSNRVVWKTTSTQEAYDEIVWEKESAVASAPEAEKAEEKKDAPISAGLTKDDFKIVKADMKDTTAGYRLATKDEVEPLLKTLDIPTNHICSLVAPHKIGGPRPAQGADRHNWIGNDSVGKEGHALVVRCDAATPTKAAVVKLTPPAQDEAPSTPEPSNVVLSNDLTPVKEEPPPAKEEPEVEKPPKEEDLDDDLPSNEVFTNGVLPSGGVFTNEVA